MCEDYHFGMPWAADGETRPSRLRTVLAQADGGVGGGALFVQTGASDCREWILASEWRAWVEETRARLFVVTDDAPWTDGPA